MVFFFRSLVDWLLREASFPNGAMVDGLTGGQNMHESVIGWHLSNHWRGIGLSRLSGTLLGPSGSSYCFLSRSLSNLPRPAGCSPLN